MLSKRIVWRNKPLRNSESTAFIPWLQDRGSLTAQLQARGNFTLLLRHQNLDMPTRDEARALNIQPNTMALIREVVLICDGTPLVFAHTVLPRRPRGSVTGWLARMGSYSLGALLFSHAGFKRGVIECKRLNHHHKLYLSAREALHVKPDPRIHLWARRSRFTFGTQTLLVTEIFSPVLRVNSHSTRNRFALTKRMGNG